MKPSQRLQLSCRRTSEAASRLGDWLDHNTALLGLGHGAVREDLDGLSQRLLALARAADAAPGIGLVSSEGDAKCDVLFGLLASGGQFNIHEFGQRPLDPGTLRRLLPLGDDDAGTAVIRVGAGEPTSAPRGYPLRIMLLSMTDVATVITKAAASALHETAAPPTAADVDALFADVSTRLSSQAIPGLSDGDVLALSETLTNLLPGHRGLASLAATRYWSTFREIAAHIPDRDRQLVLSLLWGQDKAFSALFERMAQGLAKFGHGGEAYCSAEALIGKDVSTGWITRHPRSIIHAATLFDLAHPNGAMISVMNRFGQAVEIERGVLAGLIGELPLHANGGRIEELAPAEILDFPVPHVIAGPVAPMGPGVAANDDLNLAIHHFARAKAIHLIERACLRHDLTSLVAVVDPNRDDDTFGPAIGDWVELAQGATAHARRRVRQGLHIVAAQPAEGAGQVEIATDDPSGRVRRALEGVVGPGETWPAVWTPGRPLAGMIWLERGSQQCNGAERRGTGGMAFAVAAAPIAASDRTIVQDLVEALKPASEPHVRQVQLNQAFHEVRRRFNDCVVRHHLSNAPSALADWRRGMALVTQDRIKFLAERRRLSHLFRALLPSEAEFYTAIDGQSAIGGGRLRGEASRWQVRAAGPPLRGDAAPTRGSDDPAAAGHAADRTVDHWFRAMRRVARCSRFSRGLGVEPRVVHNLVEELQLGAIRTGLAGEIAQVYRSLKPDGEENAADARRRLAAIARRLISAYLELPPGRAGAAAERPLRIAGGEGEVAQPGAPQYSFGAGGVRGGTRGAGRKRLETWDIAFVKLVEDNIASASVVMSRSEKDRELGELIQLFASGPFEVEV